MTCSRFPIPERYVMGKVEKEEQRRALPLFFHAWWDRFQGYSVTVEQLTELAEEKGLSYPLFIKHNSLYHVGLGVPRLSRLLTRLERADAEFDGLLLHSDYAEGAKRRYWLVSLHAPPPAPPEPPEPSDPREEGLHDCLRRWWLIHTDRETSVSDLLKLADDLELGFYSAEDRYSRLCQFKRLLNEEMDKVHRVRMWDAWLELCIRFTRVIRGLKHYRLEPGEWIK